MKLKNKIKYLPLVIGLLISNSTALAGGPEPKPLNPWMFYAGSFVGYYGADFGYAATYLGERGAGNFRQASFNRDLFQHGVTGGGQIGFQYHLQNPYYFGIVANVSAMSTNKELLAERLDDGTVPFVRAVNMIVQSQIKTAFDLAALLGFDVTTQAHVYAKFGTAFALMKHTVQFSGNTSPAFSQNTQPPSLWGWLGGLGLTYDFNKWISGFAEYNYHYYSIHNLNSYRDVILQAQPGSGNSSEYVQKLNAAASSFRVGLNVKYGDISHIYQLLTKQASSVNPWLVYIGGVVGNYQADFNYGATLRSGPAPLQPLPLFQIQLLNNNVFQQGISGGGQVGIQYHLHNNPYAFGVVFAALSNSDEARLVNNTDNSNSPDPNTIIDITNQFQINYNLDLAILFNVDITPRTHVYTKLGGSDAELKHSLSTNEIDGNGSNAFQKSQRHCFWGWIAGLGLTHDFNRWLSGFVEYDYYDYGANNLTTESGIFPIVIAGQTNSLTQNVRIFSSAMRLGLNVKMMDNFTGAHYFTKGKAHWTFWLGGFGGYYGADFSFDNSAFNSPVIRINTEKFDSNAFQQGVSGGGQIGAQFHLHNPYAFGLVFSGMVNSNKANVTNFIENIFTSPVNAINLKQQFSMLYNLDLAALLSIDITKLTHAYVKAGGSYAYYRNSLVVTNTERAPALQLFQHTQYKGIFGGVVGFGLNYDLNKYLNAFMEYDYYNYTKRHLDPANNILDQADSSQGDNFTQTTQTTANSVRVGLNIKYDI